MSVSYNASGKSTWQTGQTTRTATVNCSGTYRYAVAVAVSFGALPTSVKYDGVDMTLLDSWSNETGSGFYIALYGLAQPNTGSKSVVATWGSSQECFLGVAVGSSSSAAITLKDTGKGSGHSTYPAMSATADSATGDLALGACFQYDTDEYGEGYAPAVASGTVQTFTTTHGPSSDGGVIGGYKAGGSSSTTLNFTSDASGTLDWVAVLATITDAGGGGGSTDLTVANSSTGHSSDNLALTQVHNITVADTSTSHASENVVLTLGGVDLSIADTSTDHTSENVVLVEIPTLVVADTSTGNASENLDLTQDHTLAIADTSTSHASQNITLDGIPPAGDITSFDCAAGTDGLGVRGIVYDDTDWDSPGFKIAWRAKVNGGSYSSWTDSGEDNAVHNMPFEIGGSWSPGDVITVQLRSENDAGTGSESAELSFKLHESWHRTGIKPGYTVGTSLANSKGYAANGWDVVAPTHYEGTLTVPSGAQDSAVFVALDTSYAQPNNEIGWTNDVTYNGTPVTKIISHGEISPGVMGAGMRREGDGGFEAFLETGFTTGAHTLEFDWVDPLDQRSLEFVALVMLHVHQATPLGGQRLRLWANTDQAGNDGVDDVGTFGSDDFSVSTNTRFTIPSVAASLDEFVLSVAGFYGSGGNSSGSWVGNNFGEAAPTSDWNAGNNSVPRPGLSPNFNGPFTTGLTMFAGDGNVGQQVAISVADFDDCAPSFPLHDQVWRNLTSFNAYWASGYAIALRPSPNMISSLSVTSASTGSINWQCAIECNHSSVMLAVYDDADPDPTAQQLWDEIYGTGSDYSGTLLIVDEHALASGDVSATGGTISDSLAGLAFGDYKLAAAYVNWQGQVNPTNNLGDVLVDSFSITDVDLTIANTSTSHASENLDLTQVYILAIDSTSTAHASDNLDLTQDHTLAIDGSSTGNLSPNVSLGVPSEGGGGGTIGFISNIIRPIIDR